MSGVAQRDVAAAHAVAADTPPGPAQRSARRQREADESDLQQSQRRSLVEVSASAFSRQEYVVAGKPDGRPESAFTGRRNLSSLAGSRKEADGSAADGELQCVSGAAACLRLGSPGIVGCMGKCVSSWLATEATGGPAIVTPCKPER